MKIGFHGAAGTVTGSRFLVEEGSTKVLVDCGLFQGLKRLRERNWEPPPFDPTSLDAVVLTHAHIDHSGWLPLLVKRGYRGPVYCTTGTADLLRILLPDAAYLQEEDAKHANRHNYSRHQPALPLYEGKDVDNTLPLLQPVDFDQRFEVGPLTLSFAPAGHIVGAATLRVEGPTGVLGVSGDVGRPVDPVMKPPRTLQAVDWLVLESTYGDRSHRREVTEAQLAEVVNTVLGRGGTLLIPAFAVGRSQALLHMLSGLMEAGTIPTVPLYLDSPMAIAATQVLMDHVGEHRLDAEACARMERYTTFTREPKDSKKISASKVPKIVVSASGMATGGRVLHHLKAFAPDPRSGILLVGYQAAGTRGQALAGGSDELKIHGMYVPIDATVYQLHGLSAHADWRELIEWLAPLPDPRRVYLVHGEPAATQALRVRLQDARGWELRVPEVGDTVELD